ncbi:MAG: DNA-directed RNA polymerase subunit omega [Proteobacteria bacterium]|nr:DNA-directed RNA polymerase subunit omega [Pseudomonadota bacterium]
MARVTVEDCLEKIPGRFALVLIAARRTRQLLKGAEPHVTSKNREAITALREIATGSVYVEENVAEILEQHIEQTDNVQHKY